MFREYLCKPSIQGVLFVESFPLKLLDTVVTSFHWKDEEFSSLWRMVSACIG